MIIDNLTYMLSKFSQFVKTHINTIILTATVALFVLLSFATGYIIAKYQDRAPIEILNSK